VGGLVNGPVSEREGWSLDKAWGVGLCVESNCKAAGVTKVPICLLGRGGLGGATIGGATGEEKRVAGKGQGGRVHWREFETVAREGGGRKEKAWGCRAWGLGGCGGGGGSEGWGGGGFSVQWKYESERSGPERGLWFKDSQTPRRGGVVGHGGRETKSGRGKR